MRRVLEAFSKGGVAFGAGNTVMLAAFRLATVSFKSNINSDFAYHIELLENCLS
jgi:hypothetical protein